MVEPLLRVERVSKRFGGLLALDGARCPRSRPHHRADRTRTAPARPRCSPIITGFLQAERREHLSSRRGHHRRAAASAGAARHRAHVPDRAAIRRPHRAREHRGRRASAPSRARRARRRRRGRARGRPRRSARPPGRKPHGRGRKRLELARALATEPEAAAARRGAGRPQPVGDPRHGAGDPRASASAASPS